jgi:hypothetical protein
MSRSRSPSPGPIPSALRSDRRYVDLRAARANLPDTPITNTCAAQPCGTVPCCDANANVHRAGDVVQRAHGRPRGGCTWSRWPMRT